MGKPFERSFKKNSLKPNAASHNNASWYTDTDGFLEHSPSGGNLYYKGPILQKIISGCLHPHMLVISLFSFFPSWKIELDIKLKGL